MVSQNGIYRDVTEDALELFVELCYSFRVGLVRSFPDAMTNDVSGEVDVWVWFISLFLKTHTYEYPYMYLIR